MMDHLAPYMAPGVTLQDALRIAWLDSIPPHLRKTKAEPQPQPEQPRLNGISAEKRAEIIRLRKAGMTYQKIAKQVGCSVNTIMKFAKGLKVENPRLARLRKRQEALLPEALRLHEEGLDYQKIGNRLGVSRTSVRRWIQEAQA